MSKRLPVQNRVKSLWIKDTVALTNDSYDGIPVNATHVFDEDVTVIGSQLWAEAFPLDAHMNADGILTMQCGLTPQANSNMPGVLNRVQLYAVWTGILGIGLETKRVSTIMFPDPYGKEFDDGESIGIHTFCSFAGAAVQIEFTPRCLLFYVER